MLLLASSSMGPWSCTPCPLKISLFVIGQWGFVNRGGHYEPFPKRYLDPAL